MILNEDLSNVPYNDQLLFGSAGLTLISAMCPCPFRPVDIQLLHQLYFCALMLRLKPTFPYALYLV